MCVPELGRIEEVDIRTVWPNEALCFTPWLASHLSLLSEALGVDLEQGETEKRLDSLSVDILTKDGAGQTVVIENQLEPTDHDHLGRLLIYATGCEAHIVIWVATQFKDEHRATIDWLNSRTNEEIDFYGVEVRVVKIGDSLPAPDFRLVARPNTWSRQTRRAASPDDEKRRQFHQKIVDRLREQRLTNVIRAEPKYNSIRSRVSGINYFWWMTGRNARPVAVYLEIRTGNQENHENDKRIFSSFEKNKIDIQKNFPEQLEWKGNWKFQIKLPGPKASIDDPPEKLNEIKEWMLEHLLKLKQVFDPRLEEIVRQSPPEEG